MRSESKRLNKCVATKLPVDLSVHIIWDDENNCFSGKRLCSRKWANYVIQMASLSFTFFWHLILIYGLNSFLTKLEKFRICCLVSEAFLDRCCRNTGQHSLNVTVHICNMNEISSRRWTRAVTHTPENTCVLLCLVEQMGSIWFPSEGYVPFCSRSPVYSLNKLLILSNNFLNGSSLVKPTIRSCWQFSFQAIFTCEENKLLLENNKLRVLVLIARLSPDAVLS